MESDQFSKNEKRRERIHLLGVPVDLLPPEEIEEAVRDFVDDGGKHHIIFLDLPGLLKARGSGRFAETVGRASLVIPTSKQILKGARALGKPEPVRYMPFSFVIKLLTSLEKHHMSLYIVGLKQKPLETAAGNLRDSFPGLKILGRYPGNFDAKREKDVLTAIKKASPTLVLAGPGIKEKQDWFHIHREELPNSLFLWCGECFDIFAGLKKKISEKSWERGTYRFADMGKKPWTVMSVFMYLYYKLLLLWARIRGDA